MKQFGIQERAGVAWKSRELRPNVDVQYLRLMDLWKKENRHVVLLEAASMISWDSLRRLRSLSLSVMTQSIKNHPQQFGNFFWRWGSLDGCNYYKIISSENRVLFSTAACHHLTENENVPGPALLFPPKSDRLGIYSQISKTES